MPDHVETLRRLVEFFKGLPTAELRHYDKSYLDHLVAVYRGLQSWGCGTEECGAGFFHSIYGTEVFRGFILDLERGDEIVALVGQRGEALAYTNCFMSRSSFDEAVELGRVPRYRFNSWLTDEVFDMDEVDFDALCKIHLFDWLEQVPRGRRWDYRRDAYQRLAERIGGAALETFKLVYESKGNPAKGVGPGYVDA